MSHTFSLSPVVFFYVLTAAVTPSSCKTVPAAETAAIDDAYLEIEEQAELEPLGEDFVFIPDYMDELPKSEFREVWAYVVVGNERYLKAAFPISDVVYFGAEVDRYGAIVDIPRRRNLPRTEARVHVSIACGSAGLTHFLLEEGSKARQKFFGELVAMAHEYDGLNIDLEYVPLQDASSFLSLLAGLKEALGGKTLSVCVPAREAENTTYNYVNISKIADKVFVMAYDEHWATSKPGPIASMGWCKRVADYALKTIGAEKLVMGLPFYGRSWADKQTARALVAPTTGRILSEHNITGVSRENGIPKFSYSETVNVTVYFEDAYSLAVRMDMYRGLGINKVGFWRMGQEDTAVWDYITIADKPDPTQVSIMQ